MPDNKDKLILEELKKNGRATAKQIASRLGLRPSTVHSRISKLQKDGGIARFTVKVSPKIAGEEFVAFVLINTSKNLPASFFAQQSIKEAYGVTGEHDILLKLAVPDVTAFNKFIIGLRQNPAIAGTYSMIGTIEIKNDV